MGIMDWVWERRRFFLRGHITRRIVELAVHLVSAALRGRVSQLRGKSIGALEYLNVGCGHKPTAGFINMDYQWYPGVECVWDVSRRLPLKDGAMLGIFTEHCLEHLPLETARRVLRDFRRVLKPKGTIRIVLPDAQRYAELYVRAIHGESVEFPYPHLDRTKTPMMVLNSIFRGWGHRSADDFQTLEKLLCEAGFTNVRRVAFREGQDPRLLVDQEWRRDGSLYVEASYVEPTHVGP